MQNVDALVELGYTTKRSCSATAVTQFIDETKHGIIKDQPPDVSTSCQRMSSPHSTYKILLFGETGVGKTTFINAISNYLNFGTLEAARKDFTVTIDTQFIVTDDHMIPITISMHATKRYPEKGYKKEHLNSTGESSTQAPQIYKLPIAIGEEQSELHVMDTPGINDTDGMKKDDSNCRRIMAKLEEMESVHAICILMKPNEARLTSDVRYFLEKVLQLHKNTVANIFFCFTNAKDGPAQSLTSLKVYLKKLQEITKVNIEAIKDNVFWFDNSCFRYLCTIKKRKAFRTEHLDLYNSILWNQNVKMSRRFISKLNATPLVNVYPTTVLSKLDLAIHAIVETMRCSLERKEYVFENVADLLVISVAVTKFLRQHSLLFLKDPFVFHVEELVEQLNKRQHPRITDIQEWLRVYYESNKEHREDTVSVENLQLMIDDLKKTYKSLYREITNNIGLSPFAQLFANVL